MEKKIKIVLIVEAVLGGIRQHVLDIVKNLNKTKFDVYLVYSDLRADDLFFQEKDDLIKNSINLIQCNEMKRELSISDYKAYRSISKILKEIKPDIVHCHSSKAGIVGRIAAKRCKVGKIIYTPNAYAFQDPSLSRLKKKIYVLAEKFLSRHATNMTINVSKGEMELARQYKIDLETKFTLIYNGIPQIKLEEKNEIRKRLGLKTDEIYIGVTARCAGQKDPFTFLKIADGVIKQHHNVQFIYIGEGDLHKPMAEWIKQKGLADKIHLWGFREDAPFIVGLFDIYLSTALYEGMPYSVIEAMRAGVPIIATDVVGNNEIVEDGKNGLLFKPGCVEMAVNNILKQLCEGMINRDNVIRTFQEKFSLDKMMEKYVGETIS